MRACFEAEVLTPGDRSERAASVLDDRDPCKKLRKLFDIPRKKLFEDDSMALRGEYLYLASSAQGLQPKSLKRRVSGLWDRADDVQQELAGRAGEVVFCTELAAACQGQMGELLGCDAGELRLFGGISPELALSALAGHFAGGVAGSADAAGVLHTDCLDLILPHLRGEPVPFEEIVRNGSLSPRAAGCAVVLAPWFHPLTGEALRVAELSAAARHGGLALGLDVRDAAGSVLPLGLGASGADFAVFSTERFLCGGPDPLTGVFVQRRHIEDDRPWQLLERLGGAAGASPLHRLTALSEALAVLGTVPLLDLSEKAAALHDYLRLLLGGLPGGEQIIPQDAPSSPLVGLKVGHLCRASLRARRVVLDERGGEPVASLSPLYTSFVDVYRLVQHLRDIDAEARSEEAKAEGAEADGEADEHAAEPH